jgi:hypothetical protein
MNQTF